MKKTRALLTFLVVILLSSCQPLLRTVWGVKEPKYESEADLKAYLHASVLSPEYSFTLDSLNWNEVFYAKDRTFPDLLLFDSAGNQIPEKGLCVPYSQDFIDTLISIHQKNFIKTNSLKTFGDFEKMFRDYTGHKVSIDDNSRYKAIVIWAVFLGKRKGLKQLKKVVYLVKHSKYPITIYFLNVDFQTYWKKKTPSITGTRL